MNLQKSGELPLFDEFIVTDEGKFLDCQKDVTQEEIDLWMLEHPVLVEETAQAINAELVYAKDFDKWMRFLMAFAIIDSQKPPYFIGEPFDPEEVFKDCIIADPPIF